MANVKISAVAETTDANGVVPIIRPSVSGPGEKINLEQAIINNTPSTTQKLVGVAGEALSDRDAIRVGVSGLGEDPNKYYKCDASSTQKIEFVGFAGGDYALDENVIVLQGPVVDGFTGLTDATNYYLTDTPGAIGTTAGTNIRRVGTANGTTEMASVATQTTTQEFIETTIFETQTIENVITEEITFMIEPGLAGEAITDRAPVRYGVSGLGEDTSKIYLCDALDAQKIGFIGFAYDAYVAGESVKILQGPRVEGFTGLTDTVAYYLADGGGISATPGTNVFKVGNADGTTAMAGVATQTTLETFIETTVFETQTIENLITEEITYMIEPGLAGEAIDNRAPVRYGEVSQGEDATKIYECDAANADKIGFIGFAYRAYVTGESVRVLQGPRVEGFSGLTDTSDYYLADGGGIATTPGTNSFQVGTADGTTAMVGVGDAVGGVGPVPLLEKGDLLTRNADGDIVRLVVGTDGQVLQADSAQTLGLKRSTLSTPSEAQPSSIGYGAATSLYTHSVDSYATNPGTPYISATTLRILSTAGDSDNTYIDGNTQQKNMVDIVASSSPYGVHRINNKWYAFLRTSTDSYMYSCPTDSDITQTLNWSLEFTLAGINTYYFLGFDGTYFCFAPNNIGKIVYRYDGSGVAQSSLTFSSIPSNIDATDSVVGNGTYVLTDVTNDEIWVRDASDADLSGSNGKILDARAILFALGAVYAYNATPDAYLKVQQFYTV